MNSMALKTAGIIFLIVALLHVLRLVLKIEVIVNGWVLPLWFSIVGFVIVALLAWWMFHQKNE